MNSLPKVIFIDDEEHIRSASSQTLELSGYAVTGFENAESALKRLSSEWDGVVVSDIKLPGLSGLEFLEKVKTIDADIPVILITGHGDIAMAVQAIHDGAYDFIEKPFPAERLIDSVRRGTEKRSLTLENRSLREQIESQDVPGPRLIGNTPAIKQLKATITHIASTQADVLINGETGTGKEMVAKLLHEHGSRADKNFVAVNCGAVPDNLIESELFGHEAGAFTGASQRRIGKIEHANGGTLFLDEIESMPMSVQVHMLRVLQERQIERLGSNKIIPLDLRVVTASKVDLKEAAARGEFREDLYYRLNVVTLDIPPLRDRREDIPVLFHHFLLVASQRYGREVPLPSSDKVRLLLTHDWPGNVRELRNIAERYVLLGENLNYELESLMQGNESQVAITLPQQVDCFEKALIEQELTRSKGSIKGCMEALGVPRKTLSDKMRKYGLDKKNYK